MELEIRREGAETFARPLDRELIKLGTHPTCDLILEGDGVCRLHAIIERALEGDYFSVTNLGALGRTYLNGVPVTRADLRTGDELRIGPYALRLRDIREDDADFILVSTEDDALVAAPLAKVLWAATADEMESEPITGEHFIGLYDDAEPVYLLTQRKL